MPKKRGRPKKKPSERKTIHLRIPVTGDQKQIIDAALAGREFAAWARDVLLREAARGGE